jgi:hypothetical protein
MGRLVPEHGGDGRFGMQFSLFIGPVDKVLSFDSRVELLQSLLFPFLF